MYFNKKGFKNPQSGTIFTKANIIKPQIHTILRATIQGLGSYSHQGSANSGNPDFCFQIPLQHALALCWTRLPLGRRTGWGYSLFKALATGMLSPGLFGSSLKLGPLRTIYSPTTPSTLVPVKNNQCPMCNSRDTDYYVENTQVPQMCCTAQGKIAIILQ